MPPPAVGLLHERCCSYAKDPPQFLGNYRFLAAGLGDMRRRLGVSGSAATPAVGTRATVSVCSVLSSPCWCWAI